MDKLLQNSKVKKYLLKESVEDMDDIFEDLLDIEKNTPIMDMKEPVTIKQILYDLSGIEPGNDGLLSIWCLENIFNIDK